MSFPLAHIGHWYHALFYLAPIVLIGLGLWWSSRREMRREDTDAAEPEQEPVDD